MIMSGIDHDIRPEYRRAAKEAEDVPASHGAGALRLRGCSLGIKEFWDPTCDCTPTAIAPHLRSASACAARASSPHKPLVRQSRCDTDAFAQELQIAAISNKQEQDRISDSTASCSPSQRGDAGSQ
jgi:hypothetical protein